jgi:GR25 family glycosyltransferase involved in LPS biosynthesis
MSSSILLENILYINLDHRTDRLEQVNNEFETKLNIYHAERFPAIKNAKGAIGCALSHIKCLEIALERNYPYVFICEDDIEFLNPDFFLEAIKNFEKIPPKKWNVYIVSGNSTPPYKPFNNSCVNVFNCQTTTGYITHYAYYKTLIKNFKAGIELLMKYPNDEKFYAIDQYWKLLQTDGTWFMLFPPCVIQRVGYSDIEKRDVDYTRLMLDPEKRYLFANVRKMEFLK